VVNTLADDGPLANLVISGQGTACCARIALRRALLEAAQSRVVAIMGSREDLIRHSTHWAQSRDEASRLWNAINARAMTQGIRGFAATSPPAHDPDTLIDIVVARLRDRGFHHVLVRNLTQPAVEIPVVRVLVPGLIDHVSQRST
jgi:ribosomal protein S12 methylthiotransferase accessory factor